MKMSCHLIALMILLQRVVAPDPFNQFMRQHYNKRGLQTPGTSGYTQYTAPGNTLTSGHVPGAPSYPASNSQPPRNTLTYGFETQSQVTGFQASPVFGPKLLPLQASASANNLITGVGTPGGFSSNPVSGPKLLPLQASAPANNLITGFGRPGQTTRSQPSQTRSSQSLSLLVSAPRNALTLSGTSPHPSNQPLSGFPQLPLSAATPQTVNKPQPTRPLLKLTNQPQTQGSGQPVHSPSGSPPLHPAILPQTHHAAVKPSPGSVKLGTKPATLLSGAAQQKISTRRQQLPTGTQQLPTGTHPFHSVAQPTNPTGQLQSMAPRPQLPTVLRKMVLPMNQILQTNSPQTPQRNQGFQTGSSFFLPPLKPASIHLPVGAAKPYPQSPVISQQMNTVVYPQSPVISQQMNTVVYPQSSVISQQMNTVGQAISGSISSPLTYNPSQLEKWAIRSYTDDSVAKSSTLRRKSYLQLIAKRRRALASQQLSQSLLIQPAVNNARSGIDRVMPDFLTLNAARDLDCETIPEVMGLNVPKYQPMGCDDDKCPPGKECRTIRGVGMCCPSSVTSQTIRTKSSVGRYEYLGLI